MEESLPSQNTTITEPSKPNYTLYVLASAVILIVALVGAALYISHAAQPTSSAAYPLTFEIEPGMTAQAIAERAAEVNLVRSELLLYTLITLQYDPTNIHAGRYRFTEPLSTFEVANKIASNDVTDELVTVTIPEGVAVARIAEIVTAALPEFDKEAYLEQATAFEGYLFPETYYVPEYFTAAEFFDLQRQTFQEKIAELEAAAPDTSTTTLAEKIILASIIEREANDETSMRMVAGILQNRLDIGMPLQADATIEYALQQPLNELAPGELAAYLQELESPYNSYKNTGLPPTPISNPGLMAISAAFNPTPSDYFYYITDAEGTFHYAKTLTEHNRNIDTYLR